uniref:BTB domain-containing protein n=1 Tax=Glossina pallidipes TaxID=7398 RepID=A0A1A9Z5U1_GLOPL
MEFDWQDEFHEIKERGAHLLQTEKWSDCRFLVGTPPNQHIIAGHKLILAMASPVFECMFFGQMADKSDPIIIPDVQPDAFQSMMEYIYSDRINITSFDKACELCYVAKKYMLPHVVEQCTQFLWSDLSPRNACRAYEFAKLFEEPRLVQRSMELISSLTREVLNDSSFLDIEMTTLMDILDQDKLNLDSELDLFNALVRFANERSSSRKESLSSHSSANGTGGSVNQTDVVEIKMEPDVNALMDGREDDANETNVETCIERSASPDVVLVENETEATNATNTHRSASLNERPSTSAAAIVNNLYLAENQRAPVDEAMLRQAVKKIRFLTMTPQQFAEGPARSNLLQENEALTILMKISSPSISDCPMPEGFCSSRCTRNYFEQRQRDLTFISRHGLPPANNACIFSPYDAQPQCQLIGGVLNSFHVSGVCSNSLSNGSGPAATAAASQDADIAANDTRRSYCVRTVNQQYDFHNTSISDCGLTFQVDSNIWITGVQVPTQVLCGELMNTAGFSERYTEILYAHIQDMHGSRLSYTHCTSRVRYDSVLEVSFDRPVYIYRNQFYKIFVTFNKVGWYPMYNCVPEAVCNRVRFKFNVGDPNESVRDGLIRAIAFSTPPEHSRPALE